METPSEGFQLIAMSADKKFLSNWKVANAKEAGESLTRLLASQAVGSVSVKRSVAKKK